MSDRLLIIESPYYREITDALKQGAMAAIEAAGATADTVEVPGVLEIPAALSMAVASVRRGQGPVYDGYVLLGCVIRGETSHYDIVANESARAVMDLSVTPRSTIRVALGPSLARPPSQRHFATSGSTGSDVFSGSM